MSGRTILAALVAALGVLFPRFALGETAAGPEPAKAVAASSSLHDQLALMFQLGDKVSVKSLAAAQAQYERISRRRDHGPPVDYAYALVLIRQRRIDDAIATLSNVIKDDRTDLRAWRAKIWIEALGRKRSLAVSDIEALAKQLSRQEQAGSDDGEAELDTARFLGRMFAYLEGPAATSQSESRLVEQHRKQVQRSLDGPWRTPFEEGLAAVAEQFAELKQDKKESREEEQARLERERNRVDRQKSAVTSEKDGLKSKAEKVQAEVRNELANIDKDLRDLKLDYDRLEAEAAPIVAQYAILQSEAIGLVISAKNRSVARSEADRANIGIKIPPGAPTRTAVIIIDPILSQLKEPTVADAIAELQARADVQELTQVTETMNYFASMMVRFNNQRTMLNNRRDKLLVRRENALARLGIEGERLDGRAAELKRSEKMLKYKERQLEHAVDATRNKTLTSHERALGTYQEFPLEAERQRILEALE